MSDQGPWSYRVRRALGPERVGAILTVVVVVVGVLGLAAAGLAPDGTGSGPSSPSPGSVASPGEDGGRLPFEDDFESGDLDAWTESEGMSIESADPYSGRYAARASTANGQAFIFREIAGQTDLTIRVRFKVLAVPSESTYLMRTASATGTYGAGIYLTNSGTLAFRNSLAGTTTTSDALPTLDAWHELTLRQVIAGAAGMVEVGLDGQLVDALSGTQDLGAEPVGRVQLGDNNDGRAFDVVFDDFSATGDG